MKKAIGIIFILFISNYIYCQDTKDIAKKAIESTVSIVSLDNEAQPLALGSGFIIDSCLIATNVHVIEGATSAYIIKNGDSKKYNVLGYVAIDKINDLVILKVSEFTGSKLTLADTSIVEIGEKIYAIGNPKGLNGTFSEGIVSGIRSIDKNKVIQITAPISPGSSGGPVINSACKVIGIAFASLTEGQNLNFAIPIKYLFNLKQKISSPLSLSLVKLKPKQVETGSANSDIIDGVTIRNLAIDPSCLMPRCITFSIKNNLQYSVSDIQVLFIFYDATGVVVDYIEKTFFFNDPPPYSYTISNYIKPLLASLQKINADEDKDWKTKL